MTSYWDLAPTPIALVCCFTIWLRHVFHTTPSVRSLVTRHSPGHAKAIGLSVHRSNISFYVFGICFDGKPLSQTGTDGYRLNRTPAVLFFCSDVGGGSPLPSSVPFGDRNGTLPVFRVRKTSLVQTGALRTGRP